MAGELVVVYGSAVTLEANGAAIANNNVGQADDATYSVSSDGGGYPDAEFVLTCAFATAPTENTTLVLVAQELDIDSTADAQPPENGATTFKGRVVSAFVLNNVTTSQSIRAVGYDLPPLASYWLWNAATGQTVSSGWVLKARPRTFQAAA
jgi:hypothetical protein